MRLGATDHILTQQALITGEIRDALTGQPPLSLPTVVLLYRMPFGEPGKRYPLTARRYRDGHFVFPGEPITAFPRLSPGSTLSLLLRVSAVRYQTAEIQLKFPDTDLELIEETLEIDGRGFSLEKLQAPLLHKTIELWPEPIHLSGRIANAEDPSNAISGANVEVIAPESRPAVPSDESGFFTIQNCPVAQEITVRVTHTDFEQLETQVPLDYNRPINQRSFFI